MTYLEHPEGYVRLVTGDVAPDSLGKVSAHEHVWVAPSLMTSLEPEFLLNDFERVVSGVHDFLSSGGGSLVDALPLVEGRSPKMLKEISIQTAMPIVATTGFHRLRYYTPGHWVHTLDAERLASILIREVNEGMDENNLLGPELYPSHIRAGAIKIATEFHYVPHRTLVLIEAVSRAHRETGSPIMVHIEQGTAAHLVLDLFEKNEVKIDKIMLSHADRNPDAVLHKELASRNCFLGYDWMGRIRNRPDSVVYELVAELASSGFASQITFGLDLVRHTYWPSYGGGPGLQYLFGEFLPRLKKFGIAERDLEFMTTDNPQRWLKF